MKGMRFESALEHLGIPPDELTSLIDAGRINRNPDGTLCPTDVSFVKLQRDEEKGAPLSDAEPGDI